MTWSSDSSPGHGRPNTPHRFAPDGDDACAVCGAGPRFRAHQPLWWRFFHPLSTWR